MENKYVFVSLTNLAAAGKASPMVRRPTSFFSFQNGGTQRVLKLIIKSETIYERNLQLLLDNLKIYLLGEVSIFL